MKILGVGLSRTATLSLHAALTTLGFKSRHFAAERLADVLKGTSPNPNFRRYDDVDAVLDLPAAYFYDELRAAYPDLKCILTIRNEDDWWKSISTYFNDRRPIEEGKPRPVVARIRNCVYGSAVATEFLYRKKYREHNERVLRTIPPENLLVMDITAGDGWEVLCPFVGRPIPAVPFPHRHQSQQSDRPGAVASAV
jgi:hypothetical protein